MIYLLLLALNTATNSDAAKILAVFPTPSISHQMVFRPVSVELARRGHEVTVITTDPAFEKNEAPPNLTEVNVHDLSYEAWQRELRRMPIGNANDMNALLKMFTVLLAAIFKEQLKSKEVQELLHTHKQFDLILLETCVRPALIFSHIYKTPVIQISSTGGIMGTVAMAGAPDHPILFPLIFQKRVYNLTLWEKIRNIYNHYSFDFMYKYYESVEDSMLREIFGPEIPALSELSNNVHMSFLNMYAIWDGNRPMPPSVVLLGGLHQKPEKELPKELKTYLDSSKHGVVYVSFGTNAHSSVLPPEKVRMMMKVFSELPFDVIWKWDTDVPNAPKNIRVFTWLPQADLLKIGVVMVLDEPGLTPPPDFAGHPKLKLFVTQGGLQSTDEAITAAVPLIGIPILSDQWYNTEKYVRHGIGIQLGIDSFTEEEFKNAILTVIEDNSYRNNMIRLRSIIQDQPQTSLERAIWWIEHVLRHKGATHLRAPSANMSWAEYYELKIVLLLITSVLGIFIAFLVAVCSLKKYLSSNGKVKTS